MDVLITGAGGVVGGAILEHLGEDPAYSFTCLDTDPLPDRETVVADVTDYEAIRPAFEGHDAVVHLALVPGTGGASDRGLGWSDPLAANLRGINNVYEAAVEADLDSIVFASSNHAVGMVEVRNAPEIYTSDAGVTADETEPHRPDSAYGLTKSYGEDLGRLAAEAHDVRFYGLRIGACRGPEYDHPYGDAERGVDDGTVERGSDEYDEQVARMKGLWHSRRDLAHLVECCLRDDTVEWDHFYGVSANDRRWLDDLDHARETVGYEPQDDGEEWSSPPE
ncbi:NAD-dependent epimerase/dehydratase family protein [Halococcus hamelinensis]|uniref:NAD-dependent epimerase/dehydratase n=1 Tax=Halococcus hamelinensis 100A6 TaxID=1132509 RepID=M0LYK3_9EURY|nr:NAD(P)-dependent oxidoreductase [Halococcus hamelinensis]EMA38667.1 NAD-dependent epimerase/dehydratase [Halococcus hamelinensis 100A6]